MSVPRRCQHWLQPSQLKYGLVVIVFLWSALVFARTVAWDFVQWDDDINIYRNPHLTGLSLESFRWMFTDYSYIRRYVPLAWLDWALNVELFGLSPWSFHLGNIFLHATNAALVFFLAKRLFELYFAGLAPSRTPSFRTLLLGAGFTAVLWGVHPLRVETVSWSSGRIYCQAGVFFLLSLLSYLRFATRKEGCWMFYGLSVLCFGASLLTYPVGLFLVWVILVLDFFPLRRLSLGWNAVRDPAQRVVILEKVPFALVAGAVLAVTLLASRQASGMWQSTLIADNFGLFHRIMQAFYIWAYYVWKPFLPLKLSSVYTTLMQFDPMDLPFLLSGVLVLTITVLLAWKHRWFPANWAAWLCYLGLLVPMLGFTEHPHYPSDRYAYFASLVWSITLGAGFIAVLQMQRGRKAIMAVGLTLLAVLSYLTVQQSGMWRNTETLFETMIARLGNDPYRADFHWRLGKYFSAQQQPERALAQLKQAVTIMPDFSKAHENIGDLMVSQGRIAAAADAFEQALRYAPESPVLYRKLGIAFTSTGKTAEAIATYRHALERFAQLDIQNDLAWLLATAKESENRNGKDAVRLAEQVCEATNYKEPACIGTLAAAYAESGQFEEAEKAATRAATLAKAIGRPDLATRNEGLASLYRSGRAYREEAIQSKTMDDGRAQ